MKETLKSKKGITLIALVITIIVLIILAGISISMLMGENGLITKAKQGALNYQNAALEEQEMLNNFYGDFASGVAQATGDLSTVTHVDDANAATSDKILKDYQAYVNGVLVTGTMNNYSSNPEKITLTAEQKGETTIDIADGYHTDIKVDASAVYQAGVTAGEGNSETPTLLWENPNPNTTLTTATTITASKEDYPFLIFVVKTSTTVSNVVVQSVDRNARTANYYIIAGGMARTFTENNTSFSIGNYGMQIGSSSGAMNQAWCIPLKVYGMSQVPYNIN